MSLLDLLAALPALIFGYGFLLHEITPDLVEGLAAWLTIAIAAGVLTPWLLH